MNCRICNCQLSPEREEAMIVLGNQDNPTCLEHASNSKVKGIYFGFSGVAPMVIVNDVGTDKTLFHEGKEEEAVQEFFSQMTEE